MFIILFILCILIINTKDIDEYLQRIVGRSCPMAGQRDPFYCPNGEKSSSRGDANKELITYDVVLKEVRYPIIDFELSQGSESFTHSEKRYNEMFKSVDDYMDHFLDVKDDEPFRNGLFTMPVDPLKFFNDYYGNGKSAYLAISQNEYVKHNRFIKDMKKVKLTEEAQAVVDEYLPSDYDEEAYMKFIEAFGTHLGYDCNYGGLIETQVLVKNCIPGAVLNWGHLKDGMQKDNDNYAEKKRVRYGNEEFKKKTRVETNAIYGGNPLEDDVKRRVSSFEVNPVVTSCKFAPIYMPITSSPKKRNNIKKALTKYLDNHKKDLEKKMNAYKKKKKDYENDQPIPITFISENALKYFLIKVPKSKTSQEMAIKYDLCTKTFHCTCNWKRECSCYEDGKTHPKQIASGLIDLGQLEYKSTHCVRKFLHWKCTDRYDHSYTFAFINCEMWSFGHSGPGSHRGMLCACSNF